VLSEVHQVVGWEEERSGLTLSPALGVRKGWNLILFKKLDKGKRGRGELFPTTPEKKGGVSAGPKRR